MAAIKCAHCGAQFDSDEAACRMGYHLAEGWGRQIYEDCTVCPCCGSDDVEKAVCCEVCGKNHPESECEDGLCDECAEKAADNPKLVEAVETKIDDFETVYINPLFYMTLGEGGIYEAIKKAFGEYAAVWPDKVRCVCRKLVEINKSEYVAHIPECEEIIKNGEF